MIDPHFADVGAATLAPGFGGQPVTGHQRRHRHHRKHKHGHARAAPVSCDESTHQVTHGQKQYAQPIEDVQLVGGYGVPPTATGHVSGAKRHKRHRHHRHAVAAAVDQGQDVPELLLGVRVHGRSTSGAGVRVNGSQQFDHSEPHSVHHRHHHRRHSSGQKVSKSSHRSRHTTHYTSVGADGYGHLNQDLVFLERGDHSIHRQEPPAGYEYRGRIEVQCDEKEHRSRSRGHTVVQRQIVLPPPPPPPPAPVHVGPCPPGWQQAFVTPGALQYHTGGVYHGGSIGHAGLGGVCGGLGAGAGGVGFVGVGPIGTAGHGQLVAEYVIESSGDSHYHHDRGSEERVVTRPKIIEVWQKPHKHETREKSRSRTPKRPHSRERSKHRERTRSHERTKGPAFDFDRFSRDILSAIERITHHREGPITVPTHGGETHTHIYHHGSERERRSSSSRGNGEVRVIVQPIQPVFYMPAHTGGTTTTVPTVGPDNVIRQLPPLPVAPAVAPAAAPQVIYVPRNVYVPVIKPVFVPRERIIVRPQVIHVARPVLVDRPVPVTQRPIIIDRERPIPVPVRTAGQVAANTGGTNIVREEYVYRDNLPVAYGGRSAEYAGGVSYGYMPTQPEHQYVTSSVVEESVGYPLTGAGAQFFGATGNFGAGSSTIDVLDTTVNSSWQRTDEAGLANAYGQGAYELVDKTGGVGQTFQQNVAQTICHDAGQTIYQDAGQTIFQDVGQTIPQNVGQTVYQDVAQTVYQDVQPPIYQGLRQRRRIHRTGVTRSGSGASFVSGGGAHLGPRVHSFTSIPTGDLNCVNVEVFPEQGTASIPIPINF